MKIRTKYLILGCLIAATIFGMVFIIFYEDDEAMALTPFENNELSAIFPGKKYTTFYSTISDCLPQDEYDPNNNIPALLPYFLEEPNLYSSEKEVFTFEFEGKKYEGHLISPLNTFLDTCAPFIRLKISTDNLPDDYAGLLSVHVWADTGEIGWVGYATPNSKCSTVPKETVIEKANEIAAKYINVEDYKIYASSSTVSYQKEINGVNLTSPFAIEFVENDKSELIVQSIKFEKECVVDLADIDFSKAKVEELINQKISAVTEGLYRVKDMHFEGISIIKYGIPVLITDVNIIHTINNETTSVKFYTKLCD